MNDVSLMLNMDSLEASIPDDLISGVILAIRDYEEKKTCVAFMNIVIQVRDMEKVIVFNFSIRI